MTSMDAVRVDEETENACIVGQFHQPTEEDIMKCFDKYDMTHKKRRVAYIFNNVNFRCPSLPTRYGSTKDTEDFKKALIKLGFYENDISVYDDLTAKEMLVVLEQFDKENRNSDINCFICTILSHGGTGDIIYGYEDEIQLEKLLSCLRPDRSPSLTGVPKLIFVQACRGTTADFGVEKKDADRIGFENPPKIPIMADMLVFHSSFNNHPSMRDEQKGTWFIQSLSTVLEKYGPLYEIGKLLTAVCQLVASREYRSSENSQFNGCKQMPCLVSTLTKEFKFN